MSPYTNISSVPLSLAVFLATDNYDHDKSTISATTLIKPLRQIILASRVPREDVQLDLAQMMPSRMGSAIHDAIERAWKDNYKNAMKLLNFPDHVISRVEINPTIERSKEPDVIPIFLEQRAYKQIDEHIVAGKFDFVGDGRVEDFKSTSTYTAVNNTNDDKYILQGSIYRWLNPEIITKDEMAIQFIFTDWSKAKAAADPKYPQSRIQQRLLPLLSIQETDAFVRRKLQQLKQYFEAKEDLLPQCSDEDLWRSEPVFKYYKNPEKTTRSTKNFENKQEAYARLSEDGNVGVVKEVPGQVTACRYCAGFSMCTQKDAYLANGDLTI
jgi:hypothetical protein